MLKDKRGTIVIELVLAFPMLLAVMFIFLAHMQAQSHLVGMSAAAREGAREYAYTHSASEGIDRAEEVLMEYSLQNVTVKSSRAGNAVRITVERPYQIGIPFLGGKTYQLHRTYTVHEESTS